MRPIPLLLLALSLTTVSAAPGHAQKRRAVNPSDIPGVGGADQAFVNPQGFYRVVLPSGFDCNKDNPRKVVCRGTRGARSLLVLEVRDVPRSATPAVVMLNQKDHFKKKEHFREISTEKLTVDGSPARTYAFSYDYMGNVQYPIGVQALYLVRKNKLFLIHYESRLPHFRTYAKDLAKLYASFKPAQLDDGGHPIVESLALPTDNGGRKLPNPFSRRIGY